MDSEKTQKMQAQTNPNNSQLTRKSVLELTHDEARTFFLKQESYCNMDMPPYITFQTILDCVNQILITNNNINALRQGNPRDYDDVNYTILSNKDGKYAWRPIQLIHPALYVALVHAITDEVKWKSICDRFENFAKATSIACMSIPVVSLSEEKDKAEQVTKWWEDIEQKSLELSLDFEYLFETDLTDCYGSIYTHAIAWALHDKLFIKKDNNRKDKTLLGNKIDDYIQDMRHGQTNGIPQGSVLMDFVAEMVLGYADLDLSERIKAAGITEKQYYILRYRDDYRIFVNDSQLGDCIVKLLTETMVDLGLKLNSAKTKASNEVIHSAIKTDKLHWMENNIEQLAPYKALMLIHEHARQFPNTGSLVRALDEFDKEIIKHNKIEHTSPLPLIGIIVDIAYRNPKTYPVSAGILSVLVRYVSAEEKKIIVEKILKKFKRIPNTGYMEIWLQRVVESSQTQVSFVEKICKVVSGAEETLWNIDWISSSDLKKAIDVKTIVDQNSLENCRKEPFIPPSEFALYLAKISDYSQ